ncbi:MAG: thioredoxin family protein [Bacteroidales bacterium]|nr:thioredoxin family protein [Bacteroidales bacterium]MBO7268227.1 thioredoxin family protein [Bacteroidales bacterium]
MKRLIVCVAAMLLASATFAQVKWEEGTLNQALKKAKESGKELVFLDCYATWCGPCQYMAKSVFTTKEAGDYFNKKFVNIKIDMEKGEGINLARQFKIQGYPTFIILNSNGKELGRIVGGAEIKQFIQKVEGVLGKK